MKLFLPCQVSSFFFYSAQLCLLFFFFSFFEVSPSVAAFFFFLQFFFSAKTNVSFFLYGRRLTPLPFHCGEVGWCGQPKEDFPPFFYFFLFHKFAWWGIWEWPPPCTNCGGVGLTPTLGLNSLHAHFYFYFHFLS